MKFCYPQMIIVQACFPFATQLFEKYTKGVSRNTQFGEWTKVIDQLAVDGITVESIPLLRKNISIWTRRAIVRE